MKKKIITKITAFALLAAMLFTNTMPFTVYAEEYAPITNDMDVGNTDADTAITNDTDTEKYDTDLDDTDAVYTEKYNATIKDIYAEEYITITENSVTDYAATNYASIDDTATEDASTDDTTKEYKIFKPMATYYQKNDYMSKPMSYPRYVQCAYNNSYSVLFGNTDDNAEHRPFYKYSAWTMYWLKQGKTPPRRKL